MKDNQLADIVVMVSPDTFGFNPQTAASNVFQQNIDLPEIKLRNLAMEEFRKMVDKLEEEKIKVLVLGSRVDLVTPDAVFPNNWFSHHQDGTLVLYPMMADNRRLERQLFKLKNLLNNAGISHLKIIDLTTNEANNLFLEGTGSLVLDRENKIAYAMESPRTNRDLFYLWCEKMSYDPVFFHAYDEKKVPVYHTNVLMSVGKKFAVICFESIESKKERSLIIKKLIDNKKRIIPISLKQMHKFCANILELESEDGFSKIVLSRTAFEALTSGQKKSLETFGKLVVADIPTIERVGGGSARCMMAEIFIS